MTDDASAAGSEPRASERRRYNRRRPEEVTPPYYEAFERIALALEGIRDELATREISLPGTGASTPPAPRAPARRR